MSYRLTTICGVAVIEALLLCVLITGDLEFLRQSAGGRLENRAVAVVAAGVLLAALFSWLLGAWLARRLGGPAAAAGAVEPGRSRPPEPVAGGDESGRLARAVDRLAGELRRCEERFRLVADFTYDWEYWITPEGRFAWVAPACRRITGYPPERFLADAGFLVDIAHPEDRAIIAGHMLDVSQSAPGLCDLCTISFRMVRRDGATVWIEHCCRAVYAPDGAFLGRRGSNRDVTERKRAEETILAAREAAEAANRAKTQFLATMSHEVRTPLNGIMGMLQLLDTMPLPPGQDEAVAIALESSRKLLTILNDILDIARIEAGKVVLCHEAVDPHRLLPSVAGIFSGEVRARGLSLDVAVAANMPETVVADEGRLRQILFNLVGNAVKFTTSGGIGLWAGPLPVRPPGGGLTLLFTVSDTGPGIADDKVGHVFTRFSQVDDGLSRQYGGLGLGLAIVQRFVGLLGGCVCVDSEVGRGSTFYVTVRVGQPADLPGDAFPGPGALAADAAVCSIGGLTVLVVEDERINQMTLGKFLGKMGHRAVMAQNGQVALDLLARQPFDVVLMDVQMPVMDGETATRLIRSMEHGRSTIPIIALTAHAMKGDVERFLACGMDAYLAKPVDYETLRQTIARTWAARRIPDA